MRSKGAATVTRSIGRSFIIGSYDLADCLLQIRHCLTILFTELLPFKTQNRWRKSVRVCSVPACSDRSWTLLISSITTGCVDGRRIGCFLSASMSEFWRRPPTLSSPFSSRYGLNLANLPSGFFPD
ncbi:hypothetical protein T12_6623 [Trichinella patagoniensis]|uniref:Uncharacterized protein n=1 Tax=Trichinella patagoniensis TaxID=990121 RepID=A0A0V0YUV5_9BILA|nr:hypothetical protein T12_6623 [Trichinella patagoniensis]